VPLSGNPDLWQDIKVDNFYDPANPQCVRWGGANDGIIRQPFKSLMIRSLKDNGPKGKSIWHVEISEINAIVENSHAVADSTFLTPVEINHFFIAPDTVSTLRWRNGSNQAAYVDFIVRDYWGRTVSTGKALSTENRYLEAAVKLPRGFYEIELSGQRFGIVCIACATGMPDPFFAIDGAMSCLDYANNANTRKELLSVLSKCGIAMIRERLNWSEINPAQGQWRPDVRRYGMVRQQCLDAGIPVLELFHDSPEWMRAGTGNSYPANLLAVRDSWVYLTSQWSQYWGALEIWNEPDLQCFPPDVWSAMIKSVIYGVKKANSKMLCGSGTFATCDATFISQATANGILDHLDFLSFHTYVQALGMENTVDNYRQLLIKAKRDSLPLWLTETGRPWKSGTARPPMDDDQISALDCSMKIIEAKACGVERAFGFIYGFYDEGQNNFGFIGKDLTPLRVMAAYTNTIKELSQKNYIGDVIGLAGVLKARVFADKNQQDAVIVLYTGNPRKDISIKIDLPIIEASGIDGRRLTVTDGHLSLDDGLVFVRIPFAALNNRLEKSTRAMQLFLMAQQKKMLPQSASSIVMRAMFDAEKCVMSNRGYSIPESSVAALPLKIRVFNLAEISTMINFQVSIAAAGGEAKILIKTNKEIPQSGFIDINNIVDLSNTALATYGELDVTIDAVGDSSGTTIADRLVIHLSKAVTMDHTLSRFSQQIKLPIKELHRWNKNHATGAETVFSLLPDGVFQASFNFSEKCKDRWAYPQFFGLPDASRMGGISSVVINARVLKPAIQRMLAVEKNGGRYLYMNPIVPADGEWHSVVVNFDAFAFFDGCINPNGKVNLMKLDHIEIGVNSSSNDNIIEIKDVYFVGGDKTGKK